MPTKGYPDGDVGDEELFLDVDADSDEGIQTLAGIQIVNNDGEGPGWVVGVGVGVWLGVGRASSDLGEFEKGIVLSKRASLHFQGPSSTKKKKKKKKRRKKGKVGAIGTPSDDPPLLDEKVVAL